MRPYTELGRNLVLTILTKDISLLHDPVCSPVLVAKSMCMVEIKLKLSI